MKVSTLIPYCPFPVDTGARAVFLKHLKLLRTIGQCTVLSARRRPVGYGWSDEQIAATRSGGYDLIFRETPLSAIVPQLYGIGYAFFCKALKADRAFGHSNPYHRYAFSSDWLFEQTRGSDICEIHYSYWARLATACPKVVIVHDLWSEIMWEGAKRELEELKLADLVVTVSASDYEKLRKNGLKNVLWSPPVVEKQEFEDSEQVVIVGSGNKHNQEGMAWLEKALANQQSTVVNVYGSIVNTIIPSETTILQGRYLEATDPYKQNGIVLMTTAQGSGVQIKAIEALACGRAIVARKGAMRGLPTDDKGWVEVDSPEEMLHTVSVLQADKKRRRELMARANDYYQRHLESEGVLHALAMRYKELR